MQNQKPKPWDCVIVDKDLMTECQGSDVDMEFIRLGPLLDREALIKKDANHINSCIMGSLGSSVFVLYSLLCITKS